MISAETPSVVPSAAGRPGMRPSAGKLPAPLPATMFKLMTLGMVNVIGELAGDAAEAGPLAAPTAVGSAKLAKREPSVSARIPAKPCSVRVLSSVLFAEFAKIRQLKPGLEVSGTTFIA